MTEYNIKSLNLILSDDSGHTKQLTCALNTTTKNVVCKELPITYGYTEKPIQSVKFWES